MDFEKSSHPISLCRFLSSFYSFALQAKSGKGRTFYSKQIKEESKYERRRKNKRALRAGRGREKRVFIRC